MGWLYVRVFYGLRDRLFNPMPIPRQLKPAVGGLLLGLVALRFPAGDDRRIRLGAVGRDRHAARSLALAGESSFVPHMGMGLLLLLLAVLKIVATGLTISSGGSGGVFGPSMLIGGMIGGAYGQLMASLLPIAHIDPAAFVLVGMGGFFAGVSKTPLTSIVMVSEMTGSYSLLVPLMLACGLNMAISRRWTIYEEQVPSPIDSPAHQGDFVVDVLDRIQVGDVAIRTEGIEPIAAATPFKRADPPGGRSSETLFPVVDGQGRLTGIFTLRDLRLALVGSEWGPLVLADDLATRPVLSVTPEDTLHTALRADDRAEHRRDSRRPPDDPTATDRCLSRQRIDDGLHLDDPVSAAPRARANRVRRKRDRH